MAEKAQKKSPGVRGKGRSKGTAPRVARATATDSTGTERGRIALRRTTSEYRAAAQEQADRVTERIEAALEAGRLTRERIEQRIADELHVLPLSPEQAAEARAARKSHAKGHAAKK